MNVILFLGSGISLSSGLPGVSQIRDALRNAPKEPRIGAFLDLLERLDQEYLTDSAPHKTRNGYAYTGQIYRASTTYEDLFHLSSQITLNGWGILGDVTANAFADLARRKGRHFLRGRTKVERTVDLDKLASRACQFIEKTVADLLHGNNTIRGLDLVLDLASLNSIDQLYVVTLNHDTLVEQLFAANGVVYADGFSRPDGDIRWFTDEFGGAGKIAVLKPHGSINWYGSGDYDVVQPVVLTNRHCSTWKDALGNALPNIHATPAFLTGASKVSLYNRGIFASMLHEFQAALRDCELMVMSGYGWGDTPINFHLQYWLDRSVRRKLIILHKSPQGLIDRSKELSEMSRSYLRSGRIVCIEKWLEHATLQDIEPYLSGVMPASPV